MSDTQTRPSGPDHDALSELESAHQQRLGASEPVVYTMSVSTTTAGFTIQYSSPSGHNPNTEWDWIGVYAGSEVPPYAGYGNYLTWNWVCPNNSCSNTGTAAIQYDWQPNTTYTLVYFLWKWGQVANETITTPAS